MEKLRSILSMKKIVLKIILIGLLFITSVEAVTSFTSTHTISTTVDGARTVSATDIDNDGDIDLLSAGYRDYIIWYENDGSENFTSHIISDSIKGWEAVYAVDIDGDDDMDILSASTADSLVWYENNGSEVFLSHTITTSLDWITSVYAEDIDGDGDIDVLSSSSNDDKVVWYENDGSENFTSHIITTEADGANSVYAADIDSDGDIDVLSACSNEETFSWYENDGSETFSQHYLPGTPYTPQSIITADIDGDGDMDILSSSGSNLGGRITWYENSRQSFTAHAITSYVVYPSSVFATDIDGDGDIDVLSASGADDKINWYENDGSRFFTLHNISTTADGANSVYAADIDGDGDIDVLSASQKDHKIAWYENGLDLDKKSYVVRDSILSDSTIYIFVSDNSPTGTMDTIITTIKIDSIVDSLWQVTDTLINNVITASSSALFVSTSITVDTLSETTVTKEYKYSVAIEQIPTSQNTNQLVFAPNPVPLMDGEVSFVLPYTFQGKISINIFDAIGNNLESREFQNNGDNIYRWDLTNESGKKVGSGVYIAIIELKSQDGAIETYKRSIGVYR